jgi:hypothetical protein
LLKVEARLVNRYDEFIVKLLSDIQFWNANCIFTPEADTADGSVTDFK